MPTLIAPNARLVRAALMLLERAEKCPGGYEFLNDADVELAFHDLRVWRAWYMARHHDAPRITVEMRQPLYDQMMTTVTRTEPLFNDAPVAQRVSWWRRFIDRMATFVG